MTDTESLTLEPEQPETAQAFIDGLDLEYEAEFVPFTQSRNADNKPPNLNWRVTLKNKHGQSLTTDYMQGCGHLPFYNHDQHFWKTVDGDNALHRACETGRYGWYRSGKVLVSTMIGGRKLEPPKLIDVLYCLLMDSQALNYPCFEDWAEEFEYDPDSRKAESIYRACMDTALKLRQIIDLDAAQEAFQDF